MYRIFVFIGLLFLIVFATLGILLRFGPQVSSATVFVTPASCKGCICQSCSGGGGGSGPVTRLSDATLQGQVGIKYQWPAQMDINSSSNIGIDLVLLDGGQVIPDHILTPTAGNQQLALNFATPVGTEATTQTNPVSISQAFGPGYTVSAVATLITTTFNVKGVEAIEQPLDQAAIAWNWDIRPSTVGTQIVDADVDLIWKSLSNQQTIEREIWQTQIPITVTQAFIDKGQLQLGEILSASVGGGGIISGLLFYLLPGKKEKNKA
jgi:hypothetical protein